MSKRNYGTLLEHMSIEDVKDRTGLEILPKMFEARDFAVGGIGTYFPVSDSNGDIIDYKIGQFHLGKN